MRRPGRPKREDMPASAAMSRKMLELHESGISYRQIGQMFSRDHKTVRARVARARREARVQAVLQDVARVAQVVKRRREQGKCLRMN